MAVPGAQCYAFIPPSIPGLGVSSGISVQVQDLEGKGTSYLAENAFRLIDSLHGKPGVASVTTQFNDGVPQRRLVIDKEQALSQGVSLGELYNELTTLLGGAYINNFNRFGKLYQTYVQAAPDYRRDARSVSYTHLDVYKRQGLRWEFKNRVNVRFDFGFGRKTSGFLFNVNEAF